MAMSVGSSDEELSTMATINTTPLVDVMLVLLIIFLITIPVITKQVPLVLPKAVNIPTQTKPENITVAINHEGQVFWNGKAVQGGAALLSLVEAEAVKKPQPEIHIRADKDALYAAVGHTLYEIQRGGVVKVGFITEPDHGMMAAPQ
jgi:biopolymer transport protein ExbD